MVGDLDKHFALSVQGLRLIEVGLREWEDRKQIEQKFFKEHCLKGEWKGNCVVKGKFCFIVSYCDIFGQDSSNRKGEIGDSEGSGNSFKSKAVEQVREGWDDSAVRDLTSNKSMDSSLVIVISSPSFTSESQGVLKKH